MEKVGLLYALGAAITWGLVYAIDQKNLASVSPLTLLFINSVLSAIFMIPFLFLGNISLKEVLVSGKVSIALILVSVVLGVFASFLIFSGIKVSSASAASIIEIAYPFFVVFFSYILFRTTPNFYFFLGGIFIFIGSVIIIRFA